MYAVALMLTLSGLSSCTALVSPDPHQLDPQPSACSPGTAVQCPCSDGTWSVQACNTSGGYDPCVCGTTAQTGATQGGAGHGPPGGAPGR